MKKIDVLLATYNGASYIKDQINSLLINFEYLQNYTCRILISDDGSTDNTIELINDLLISNKVILLDYKRKNGVRNNFTFLLKQTEADYVFFCDQDDLWLPKKMKIFMDHFTSNEMQNKPLLIHSDLCVSNKELSPIHTSMFEYQKLNNNPSFGHLLVSNSITGCVCAINNPLLILLKKSSISESIMHDWYAALVASAFGQIIYIPKSLILYRQHDKNQVGAKKLTFGTTFFSKQLYSKYQSSLQSVEKTRVQAELFLSDYGSYIDSVYLTQASDYINSFKSNIFVRLYLFLFKDINKTGMSRIIGFFIVYVILGNRLKELAK
ncbi:glycosyltransferase family 2 protein [Sodalis sp. RH21]|uniref:glycosyltransferase family 2 protein n=1 Tax=unclassified Sodalis (in: enterobacteria) TaxID=2636512 RepID=UPI0039B5A7AB